MDNLFFFLILFSIVVVWGVSFIARLSWGKETRTLYLMVLCLSLGGITLYGWMGRPYFSDVPYQTRPIARIPVDSPLARDALVMMETLGRRLERDSHDNPDACAQRTEGWQQYYKFAWIAESWGDIRHGLNKALACPTPTQKQRIAWDRFGLSFQMNESVVTADMEQELALLIQNNGSYSQMLGHYYKGIVAAQKGAYDTAWKEWSKIPPENIQAHQQIKTYCALKKCQANPK